MNRELPLNFTLSFCGEIRPGHGEDNWFQGYCQGALMLGVFDGCGGAGARSHQAYAGHTEAYMASRFCSGAFYEGLLNGYQDGMEPERFVSQVLLPHVKQRFSDNTPPKEVGGLVIGGSLMRTLPTTVATVLIRRGEGKELEITPIWAGDSRVYILDADGLAQLTVDDTTVSDPLENLYDDGVLRNIVCTDREFRLHSRTIRVKPPFMVLAATDGCFGYVSTPMEFEGMLLESLLDSQTVAGWEERLRGTVASVASDDHTLCLAAFGYPGMEAVWKVFGRRYEVLKRDYLDYVRRLPPEDRDSRRALWAGYRQNYMRYIEGGT